MNYLKKTIITMVTNNIEQVLLSLTNSPKTQALLSDVSNYLLEPIGLALTDNDENDDLQVKNILKANGIKVIESIALFIGVEVDIKSINIGNVNIKDTE